jgi:hypothetical protein
MKCEFSSLTKGTECSRGCGRKLAMTFTVHPRAECKSHAQPGDALEELLTSYGITKEWWTEYKSQHGLPPTCGCDSRREYLNNLSKAHPNLAKYGVMVFRALTRKKP